MDLNLTTEELTFRDELRAWLVFNVPKDWNEWHPSIRNARRLSESLISSWTNALLFRTLATLRLEVPVFNTVDDLRWKGPLPSFEEHCHRMKSPELLSRATLAGAKHTKD